ncbi:kynureninase [Oceanobacillus jeddahense]|uniref:Kynureninase n=1 Tax=Oceanobacillus jeddahense TaxID=1462527 RepID=A0ABY5K028_9BACI|nr:kynureninase [Oceanobacillus jeddahense]UUI04447.1 kynureninase [Oceanobacillus jeddahense]
MVETHTKAYAAKLDTADELKAFRNEFHLKNECVYMDGNSLGLMSKRAEQTVYDLMASWKEHAIDGWTDGNQPWYYLSESLGEKMSGLVGAKKEEVIVTGSTTVNLHQLVSTFYEPEGKRTKILADSLNFPSDIYALKTQLKLQGYDDSHLIQVDSEDGHMLDEEAIINAMTEDIALIVLPSVLYRSGQILDMEKLTRAAHERGIKIGFDLCHSIGAIPHQLHDWEVDFAFWCTYKHLNGGPGSVAALYVNEKHFGTAPGLAGWFSSNKEQQFDMEHTLTPAEHAGAFQIGTPHVLSAAPLIGALELFHEAGIEKIRSKSLQLTAYMIELIEHELKDFGFVICNPVNEKQRGGHIYLEHPEAARICKALKMKQVIPDFRKPSGIRLAPVALYNSFEDVYECVQRLKQIMEDKVYEQFSNEREVVS